MLFYFTVYTVYSLKLRLSSLYILTMDTLDIGHVLTYIVVLMLNGLNVPFSKDCVPPI